ncbi:DNA mismatch repair protein [Vibrio sp. 1180_3]|nr:DNA mismatch repair protein [Vibrio sp. 1180_3]
MTDQESNEKSRRSLRVTKEENRKNNFISSLLYSRLTIFHPAQRLNSYMQSRLELIAKNGGTDFNTPLESQVISSYGTQYKIELFVDYLLQGHRDVLDTLLAYGTMITLDDEAYNKGKKLTWSEIYGTLPNAEPSKSPQDAFNVLDSGSVVLSMSMYDLATQMGLRPHRDTYDKIERRIAQLHSAYITASQLDDDGEIIDRAPIRFIEDFRLLYDHSKNKNGKAIERKTNHVFVVPDRRLLKAIRDHGYFLRLEQQMMRNYSQPTVRSFLKYMRTHKSEFIHGKRFDWLVDQYVQSIPTEVGRTFKALLKKNILSMASQIEMDFQVQFRKSEEDIKIFYVGSDEE